jgi:hypothetical protein
MSLSRAGVRRSRVAVKLSTASSWVRLVRSTMVACAAPPVATYRTGAAPAMTAAASGQAAPVRCLIAIPAPGSTLGR